MDFSPVSLPAEAQGVAGQSADLGLEELLEGGKLSESTLFVAEKSFLVHQEGMLEVDRPTVVGGAGVQRVGWVIGYFSAVVTRSASMAFIFETHYSTSSRCWPRGGRKEMPGSGIEQGGRDPFGAGLNVIDIHQPARARPKAAIQKRAYNETSLRHTSTKSTNRHIGSSPRIMPLSTLSNTELNAKSRNVAY